MSLNTILAITNTKFYARHVREFSTHLLWRFISLKYILEMNFSALSRVHRLLFKTKFLPQVFSSIFIACVPGNVNEIYDEIDAACTRIYSYAHSPLSHWHKHYMKYRIYHFGNCQGFQNVFACGCPDRGREFDKK